MHQLVIQIGHQLALCISPAWILGSELRKAGEDPCNGFQPPGNLFLGPWFTVMVLDSISEPPSLALDKEQH